MSIVGIGDFFARATLGDTWLHHLIFPTAFKKGALHPKLWEKLFEAPPVPRPWFYEISGRLLSIVGSDAAARAHAEEICRAKIAAKPTSAAVYLGLLKLAVIDVVGPDPQYGVFHEPSLSDVAHANLVRFTDFPRLPHGVIAIAAFRNLDKLVTFVAP